MPTLNELEIAELNRRVSASTAVAVAKAVPCAPMTLKRAREGLELRGDAYAAFRAYLSGQQPLAEEPCEPATDADCADGLPAHQKRAAIEPVIKVPLRQLMSCMTDDQLESVVSYGQALLSGRG